MESFINNPVMLYNHDNNKPEDVIGKWDNVRIEETHLLADAEIDSEEEFAIKVGKKVEKGYINGASIRFDFDFEDVQLGIAGFEDVPVITKCLIKEASICPIPGNRGAVRLYGNGEEIKDNSKALSLSLSNKQKTEITMRKELILITAALGITLSETTTDAHVVEAINNLKNERDSFKLKLDEATNKLSTEQDAKCIGLIDAGIASKKLKAEQRDHYIKLAKLDFASTKEIIDGMTAHVTLSSQLGKGTEESSDKQADWDYRKFHKENPFALLSMKANDPARYKKLWQEAYPTGTYNG